MTSETRRFTVEATAHNKRGNPTRWGIRYSPRPQLNADGSKSFSLSFIMLEAGEFLGDQEAVLSAVSDLLEKDFPA